MHMADARHLVVGSGTTSPLTLLEDTRLRRHTRLVVLALLLFPSLVSADLLFVVSNSWEGGSAFTSTSNDPLYFAFGNFTLEPFTQDQYLLTNAVYDDYAFTRLDIGNVFYLTAAEDPDFTQLAANLVNGQPDRIGWVTAYTHIGADYGGTQTYEAGILAGSPFLTNGIDLQGTVIDRFSLVVNDLNLDSPGSDPNNQGVWTDLRFSVTLSIEGHVIPEPSTVLLMLAGASAVLLRNLTRKSRSGWSRSRE